MNRPLPALLQVLALASIASVLPLSLSAQSTKTITGQAAFADYSQQHPGVRRKITVADLPAPTPDESVDNGADMVPRPKTPGRRPPKASRSSSTHRASTSRASSAPRPTATSSSPRARAGEVKVLRDADGDGKPQTVTDLRHRPQPALRHRLLSRGPNPQCVYVGNTDSVVRFPYKNGDLKATRHARDDRARSSPATPSSAAAATGRATSPSPRTASACSSRSARARTSTTPTRIPARSTAPTSSSSPPTASSSKIYASGIRNPVGLAIHPTTGQLWSSVNERDGLGDNLVPDYITHVEEGGFYGWPWYYIGGHQDPRHEGKHPELKDKVIVPDVLLQSHSASLDMTFYDRHAVSRRVRRRRLRRRARLVEPRPAAPATRSSASR